MLTGAVSPAVLDVLSKPSEREILRTGTGHKDPHGRVVYTVTESLIDAIIANHRPGTDLVWMPDTPDHADLERDEDGNTIEAAHAEHGTRAYLALQDGELFKRSNADGSVSLVAMERRTPLGQRRSEDVAQLGVSVEVLPFKKGVRGVTATMGGDYGPKLVRVVPTNTPVFDSMDMAASWTATLAQPAPQPHKEKPSMATTYNKDQLQVLAAANLGADADAGALIAALGQTQGELIAATTRATDAEAKLEVLASAKQALEKEYTEHKATAEAREFLASLEADKRITPAQRDSERYISMAKTEDGRAFIAEAHGVSVDNDGAGHASKPQQITMAAAMERVTELTRPGGDGLTFQQVFAKHPELEAPYLDAVESINNGGSLQ